LPPGKLENDQDSAVTDLYIVLTNDVAF
jgi:hypothetical protein